MRINRYLNAFFCILKAPYILKGRGKTAFGIPFLIHRFMYRKAYKKLEEFKGVHAGERCFVVGTGPSLNERDLAKLSGEHCFGVNSIVKILDDVAWKPEYYCITDPLVYEVLEPKIRSYPDLIKFYPSNRIKTDLENGIRFPLDCIDMYRVKARDVLGLTKFSSDIKKRVYNGATVVYATLQIAVYMGFSEIYLLGVDCNYEIGNNFHNKKMEYDNDNYQYRDNEQTGLIMIDAFKIAKEYADEHNVRIYNASTGGMLEVFPRVRLEEVTQH